MSRLVAGLIRRDGEPYKEVFDLIDFIWVHEERISEIARATGSA